MDFDFTIKMKDMISFYLKCIDIEMKAENLTAQEYFEKYGIKEYYLMKTCAFQAYRDDCLSFILKRAYELGYFLNPNSDEFKLKIEAKPLWYLSTNASYTLVRHGITADGSSFYDPLNYSGNLQDPQEGDIYWKDFLHDGIYEWINSISLGAVLDCAYWNLPITLGLSYTFIYTHHTLGNKDGYHNIDNEKYSNKAGNYLTLSLKVFQ